MSVVHPITSPPAMKVSFGQRYVYPNRPQVRPILLTMHFLIFRQPSQFPAHFPAKSYKSNARMDRDDIFGRAVWS